VIDWNPGGSINRFSLCPLFGPLENLGRKVWGIADHIRAGILGTIMLLPPIIQKFRV
jgi:hypothetical protein